MKTNILPLLLGAGLLGGAGGALTASLLSHGASAARSHEPAASASERPELHAGLERLKQRIGQLEERLLELELQPVPVREPVAAVPHAEGEPSPAVAAPVPLEGSSSELVGQVELALGAIREREREERRVAAEERRIERNEARLDKLAERLQLNAGQVGDLRQLWTSQSEAREELRRLKGEVDKPTLREIRRSFEEEHEAELTRILTLDQRETYDRIERRRRDEGDEAKDSRKSPRKGRREDEI